MTPGTVVPQAPLSMEFSRQEYWSDGLPLPTLGDLPDPGIGSVSLASLALAGRFFIIEPPQEATSVLTLASRNLVFICFSILQF